MGTRYDVIMVSSENELSLIIFIGPSVNNKLVHSWILFHLWRCLKKSCHAPKPRGHNAPFSLRKNIRWRGGIFPWQRVLYRLL